MKHGTNKNNRKAMHVDTLNFEQTQSQNVTPLLPSSLQNKPYNQHIHTFKNRGYRNGLPSRAFRNSPVFMDIIRDIRYKNVQTFQETVHRHKWLISDLTFSDKLDILQSDFMSGEARLRSDG